MSRLALLIFSIALVGCGSGHELRLESHGIDHHVLKVDPHDRVHVDFQQHPRAFDLYQVRTLLAECYYTYSLYGEWSAPRRIFSVDQVDRLGQEIWQSLEGARRAETIHFAISAVDYGFFREDGEVTSGWLYVAGDRWHIGFDSVLGHPFRGGRRRASVDSGEDGVLWEISPSSGQRYHVDRDGDEDRSALEISIEREPVDAAHLPEWRDSVPWEGYRPQDDRDWTPPHRPRTDRYWNRVPGGDRDRRY